MDAHERDGIVTSAAYLRGHSDTRALVRAVDRGELIRLRRGVYVRAEVWNGADGTGRHLLRVRAALSQMSGTPILTGFSAAAVWGMPVMAFPDVVTIAEEWKGGGRSAPGVRRTAAAFTTAAVVERDGFRLTTPSRTALELTRTVPFAQVIGSLDWLLWRKNPDRITREELAAEVELLTRRFGLARAQLAAAFATDLSDSYGESLCRALIHEAGFDRPTLQLEIRDAQGVMRPDFAWERDRVLLEFDGRGKYLRGMGNGDEPGEVVWREKRREDRLRALGWTVMRATWADLMRPERLIRLLVEARVSRSIA
ncbi:MAG: type IV toxin-antitoxin system AbiEi family antitoxin domain-containing protein [Microbacteriaceae bacterium]